MTTGYIAWHAQAPVKGLAVLTVKSVPTPMRIGVRIPIPSVRNPSYPHALTAEDSVVGKAICVRTWPTPMTTRVHAKIMSAVIEWETLHPQTNVHTQLQSTALPKPRVVPMADRTSERRIVLPEGSAVVSQAMIMVILEDLVRIGVQVTPFASRSVMATYGKKNNGLVTARQATPPTANQVIHLETRLRSIVLILPIILVQARASVIKRALPLRGVGVYDEAAGRTCGTLASRLVWMLVS